MSGDFQADGSLWEAVNPDGGMRSLYGLLFA